MSSALFALWLCAVIITGITLLSASFAVLGDSNPIHIRLGAFIFCLLGGIGCLWYALPQFS